MIILLYACFVGLVYLLYIIMYFVNVLFIYCCSIIVVVMLLTFCWCVGFALALCVTVPEVSCSWFCFYIGCMVRVLLTGVHFLQCSEYIGYVYQCLCY
jgi:hypothetical protein